MPAPTIADLVTQALATYVALSDLGEGIDDEWSYVQDLSGAWREELDALATARAGVSASDAQAAAIERICDEAGRITDPHRAIDWLSTFPQVVLLALGADEGTAAATGSAAGAA
ncbi:MAG: hypothetical protein KF809_08410 [Chloroflexi bacterium]|nr:hypothetical protein [Chloroflexota bacterium]